MRLNGTRIRCILAEQEVTQAQLAQAAGVSQQAISALLTRNRGSGITAGKIAKVLGCNVQEIIETEEE